MPNISERGNEIPASPIRKLVPYAEQAKRKGIKVYHLNIGQPDIKTPEVALEAVRNITDDVIEYSHSAGNESYRKGLAGYYRSVGVDVNHEQIIVTTGGSEALMFTMLSTTNPGDEIIIPEPFYTNYNSMAQASSINVVPIKSHIDEGFALPPIEKFKEAITERTKAIFICNPSNPTGYMYSKEELDQLRELVESHNLFLVADEVYREFVYDGLEHKSVLELEGLENHAIMVDSVSKRYSECGIRIGAVVSRNKDFMATVMKLGQARLSPPYFGQVAAQASLQAPKSYFNEVYHEYIARRNYLINALNEIKGVKTPMPRGAFYSIVHLPVDDAEKFCQWLLEKFSYKGQTIMLAPAAGFYASPGMGKQEVRIAYVLKKESLQNAVEVLKEALEAYPHKDKKSLEMYSDVNQ